MELIVEAERMAAGGDAIAHEPSGRIVFVTGALPGETVRIEITNGKKDFARGRVVEVLAASAARIEPPCSALRAGCGGCSWQHIDPAAQRALKLEIARDAYRRTARMADVELRLGNVLPAAAARTTVRAVVGRDGRAGFRAARSHDVVVPGDCLVAHPAVEDMLRSGRFDGADEVVLRVGARTGERLAWATGHRARVRGLPGDVRIGAGAHVREIVLGRAVRASAPSFFQSSPEAAEAIAREVIDAGGDLLAGASTVVDAYGGVGLFAATAAPATARVIVVEQSESSIADARVNLADRDAVVVRSPVERWAPTRADVVIADPARSGLGRDAVAVVAATRCLRLVLVSCDPVAAARDAALLAESGFALRWSTLLDPFPHTPHVELVSRFDRIAIAD